MKEAINFRARNSGWQKL